VYNIIEAEDKTRQTAKEVTQLGAGVAGGAAGAAVVVALVSNPAGWVVGVAMFVTAALFGVGADEAFEYYWPEKK
jgi:hypothetical protein